MNNRNGNNMCSVCGGPFVARGQDEVFHECKVCGVVKNTAFSSQEYGDTYFNEEYEQQYGKSYEDDFPSIYSLARKRIALINCLSKKSPPVQRVCDIGSALGFFLKACSDLLSTAPGCRYEGIEVSRFAADYCTEKFGFPVFNGPLKDFHSSRKFQLVSAWYCLEHMADPVAAITSVSEMLEQGGIVAFSLPSPFGPGWKLRQNEWMENHPVDHSYDFTPKAVRIILKRLGFTDIIIRPAAVHPERVVSKNSMFFKLFVPLYRIYSEMTAFSDTIEVFARKR